MRPFRQSAHQPYSLLQILSRPLRDFQNGLVMNMEIDGIPGPVQVHKRIAEQIPGYRLYDILRQLTAVSLRQLPLFGSLAASIEPYRTFAVRVGYDLRGVVEQLPE